MKILIFPGECCPFHGKTLEERPLGGTETAIIRLAEALHTLGEQVCVVTREKEIPSSTPPYIHYSEVEKLGRFDAVLVVRDWKATFIPFKTDKIYLWTGDNWDNPHTFGIGDPRVYNHLQGLLTVSHWQADTLAQTSGYPREKISVLPNGIFLPYFQGHEQRRKRMIYTATPERGLVHLIDIFPSLKAKHPDLELAVFSSFDRYLSEIPLVVRNDKPYFPIYEKLAQLPGVTIHQSVLQEELARELMQSTLFAYPSHFEETSCISAMEAQAAGCVVVTSDLAALKETVGDAGIIISGDPASTAYRQQFVEACDRVLSNPAVFNELSQKGLARAINNSWMERGKSLIHFLKGEEK